jgi:hypothetical protein
MWVREALAGCYTRKARSGLAWFKAGTWKMKRMREGYEKGRRRLCRREENFCIYWIYMKKFDMGI